MKYKRNSKYYNYFIVDTGRGIIYKLSGDEEKRLVSNRRSFTIDIEKDDGNIKKEKPATVAVKIDDVVDSLTGKSIKKDQIYMKVGGNDKKHPFPTKTFKLKRDTILTFGAKDYYEQKIKISTEKQEFNSGSIKLVPEFIEIQFLVMDPNGPVPKFGCTLYLKNDLKDTKQKISDEITDNKGMFIVKFKTQKYLGVDTKTYSFWLDSKNPSYVLESIKSDKISYKPYRLIVQEIDFDLKGKIKSSDSVSLSDAKVSVLLNDTLIETKTTGKDGNYNIVIKNYKVGDKVEIKVEHNNYNSAQEILYKLDPDEPYDFTLIPPTDSIFILAERSRTMNRLQFLPLKRAFTALVENTFPDWPISGFGSFNESSIDMIIPFGNNENIKDIPEVKKIMSMTAVGGSDIFAVISELPGIMKDNDIYGAGENKIRVLAILGESSMLDFIKIDDPRVKTTIDELQRSHIELNICIISRNADDETPAVLKEIAEKTGGQIDIVKISRNAKELTEEFKKLNIFKSI